MRHIPLTSERKKRNIWNEVTRDMFDRRSSHWRTYTINIAMANNVRASDIGYWDSAVVHVHVSPDIPFSPYNMITFMLPLFFHRDIVDQMFYFLSNCRQGNKENVSLFWFIRLCSERVLTTCIRHLALTPYSSGIHRLEGLAEGTSTVLLPIASQKSLQASCLCFWYDPTGDRTLELEHLKLGLYHWTMEGIYSV